jgi:hypothetical protein
MSLTWLCWYAAVPISEEINQFCNFVINKFWHKFVSAINARQDNWGTNHFRDIFVWASNLPECWKWEIPVAALSKVWTVFSRLNSGILGSNPTQGIDVYVRLFCVWVVLFVGNGLAMGLIACPRNPIDCV